MSDEQAQADEQTGDQWWNDSDPTHRARARAGGGVLYRCRARGYAGGEGGNDELVAQDRARRAQQNHEPP